MHSWRSVLGLGLCAVLGGGDRKPHALTSAPIPTTRASREIVMSNRGREFTRAEADLSNASLKVLQASDPALFPSASNEVTWVGNIAYSTYGGDLESGEARIAALSAWVQTLSNEALRREYQWHIDGAAESVQHALANRRWQQAREAEETRVAQLAATLPQPPK